MTNSRFQSVDDLLTPEQLADLRADLDEISKTRRQAEDSAAHIRMALTADNEKRWRTDGEGRLDIHGKRWYACDPYPTWYRWEDGVLHQSGWGQWAEGNHPLDTDEDND